MSFAGYDVYLNIAGGLKITDPAADLAVTAALASSLKDTKLYHSTVFIGEIGLGGEIRKVSFIEQRLKEAEKMGMKNAVSGRVKKTADKKINVQSAVKISDFI